MNDIDSSTASVTDAVNAHVAQIVGAAERAALDLQREVERESARRAASVRLEAEEDADRIRAAAEHEAQAYLDDTRLRIDAFASARVERITELTDALLARAEAIQVRLDDAIDLEGQLRDLVSALGAAARAAAAEGSRPAIRLPGIGGDAGVGESRLRPAARRRAEAAAEELAASADAGARVQQLASALPRRSPGASRHSPSASHVGADPSRPRDEGDLPPEDHSA